MNEKDRKESPERSRGTLEVSHDRRWLAAAALAVLVALALPSLIAFAPAPAAAEEGTLGKSKELEDVKKRLREEKKALKHIERKETSMLGDLEDVDKTIVSLRAELARLGKKLDRLRSDMATANGRIRKLEKEREALVARLSGRLEAMYKIRRGETMSVLFGSGSAAELARRHKYLTVIMEKDSELIGACEANITELTSERAKLKEMSVDLDRSRKELAAKKRDAEGEKRKKRTLLASIKREKGRTEAMVAELTAAAEELAKLLKDLKASDDIDISGGGFSARRGRLEMPVKGRIVTSYGKVTHPRFKTVTFNNGIVIDAPAGTPVKSVHDGVVAYTGWLKGYGQIMIVDNGGGYYTLFAYLSRILKERGEKVEKGAEIALVGDTGPSAEPGLYFEIRQRGVPKDPVPWFASRR